MHMKIAFLASEAHKLQMSGSVLEKLLFKFASSLNPPENLQLGAGRGQVIRLDAFFCCDEIIARLDYP